MERVEMLFEDSGGQEEEELTMDTAWYSQRASGQHVELDQQENTIDGRQADNSSIVRRQVLFLESNKSAKNSTWGKK
jgi:hypothetical protein